MRHFNFKINLARFSPQKMVQERMDKKHKKSFIRVSLSKALSKCVPGFIKRRAPRIRLDPLTEKKFRFLIAWVQVLFLYSLFCLAVFFALNILVNISLTEPSSPKDILGEAKNPKTLFYTTQVHRIKNLDGENVVRDELIQVLLDAPHRKYQVVAAGVAPETVKLLSDGKRTVIVQGQGRPQELKPGNANVKDLIPVLPKELVNHDPKIITDTATVDNVRGWEFSFKPSGAILKQMLLSSFLDLNDADIDYLNRGEFHTVYAHAAITRSAKEMLKLDVVFTVHGAKYRVFTQYRLFGNKRLKDYDLNKFNSTDQAPIG